MKIPIIILLAVSLWNCTFPEENERIKLNFTPITQHGLIDIYSEEVIDSNLLLFTKENGILIVEPNLFVRRADDLGSKWKFTWSRNDSLFVGKDPEHYFYAKIIDQKLIVDTAQTHEYTFLPEMPFYEDDDYIMTKCCQGEFGGAVFMKSKKTPQWERAIDATCPIQVIKKGQNSYYIVTYLGHLSSHSTIIQINDINNINRYPILDPTYCSYFIQYYFLGNDGNRPDISYDSLQSKILGKGNHVILDTIGTHILKGNLTPKNELEVLYLTDGHLRHGKVKNKRIEDSYLIYQIPGLQFGHSATLFSKDRIYFITEEYLVDQSWNGTKTAVSVLLIDQNDMRKIKAITFHE